MIAAFDRVVDEPNRGRRGLAVLAMQLRDDGSQSFAVAATRRHQLQRQIARALNEVLEDRYGKLSTVVTSQLPIAKWHEWIGDPTVADAVLDRLVPNAYKLELRGNSRRKEKATPN